jgi:hypothetical protein
VFASFEKKELAMMESELWQPVFTGDWGRVVVGVIGDSLVYRFALTDSRLGVGDAKLVWSAIQDMIDHSSVGEISDDRHCDSEHGDLSLSFARRLRPKYLPVVMEWLASGEAERVIGIGVEFVVRSRNKAIELDVLQGFYHLHPKQMQSLAWGDGVEPSYVEQMRSYGLDVECWPMSVIPTCKVQTGPWIGGVYAEHALAQPVIRTGWGWVTLERGIEGSIYPEGGVVISVSLYESMRDVEDSYWGINLCDDFSRWHQHFAETFPYIGECVQIVESIKGHQTFAFALQERFEKGGWVELLDWLQTGALDREIERFATAQNLSTAELQRYFDRVQYPAGEREAMRELGVKVFAQAQEDKKSRESWKAQGGQDAS